MFNRYSRSLTLIALWALTLSACSSGGEPQPNMQSTPTTPLPVGSPTTQEPTGKAGRANVESIEIVMRESMPVQISANIKGTVSDACTKAEPITQEHDETTFRITVGATRPQGGMCAQVITPFEVSVSLDAIGLRAGTYTVEANGVKTTFDLPIDNVLP
jgi:inhibitor of cysteine peptidase